MAAEAALQTFRLPSSWNSSTVKFIFPAVFVVSIFVSSFLIARKLVRGDKANMQLLFGHALSVLPAFVMPDAVLTYMWGLLWAWTWSVVLVHTESR